SKHVTVFGLIIIAISIITGIIYAINNPYDLTDYIASLDKHNNLLFNHLAILFLFLLSTLSILGSISQIFIIGFESVSMGYVIGQFFLSFKFKGITYAIITIFINKIIFLIILLYLLINSYIYIRKSFHNIVGLSKDYFSQIILPILLKYGIVTIFVVIYDIIMYFFGNMLLKYLTFML
ncbi:MAG: hypothetical protein K2G03_03660, partial [Bacilli bacterium]|nr:hypothetical protein [Bacilli bacterium]